MWEPRRLTTLWASKACYGDSFTFFFLFALHVLALFLDHPSIRLQSRAIIRAAAGICGGDLRSNPGS
jgi:hypothetical protein